MQESSFLHKSLWSNLARHRERRGARVAWRDELAPLGMNGHGASVGTSCAGSTARWLTYGASKAEHSPDTETASRDTQPTNIGTTRCC